MILAATIVSMIVAAFLLLVQAKAQHSVATGVLGSGFAFAAATLVPYSLIYPGMFRRRRRLAEHQHGDERPAVVHVARRFALGHHRLQPAAAVRPIRLARAQTGTYVRHDPGDRVGARSRPASLWIDGLPSTFENGHWTWMYTLVQAPIMVALAAIVIASTVRRKRSTVLDLWISLAASRSFSTCISRRRARALHARLVRLAPYGLAVHHDRVGRAPPTGARACTPHCTSARNT